MSVRQHDPQYRRITARLVTVTCTCGWVLERVTPREARSLYDHHVHLHRGRPDDQRLAEGVLALMQRIAESLGVSTGPGR